MKAGLTSQLSSATNTNRSPEAFLSASAWTTSGVSSLSAGRLRPA